MCGAGGVVPRVGGAGLRVVACDDDDGVDLLVCEVERVVVEVDADAVVGGGGSGEGDVWENAHVEDGLSFCAFCADLRDHDGVAVGDFVEGGASGTSERDSKNCTKRSMPSSESACSSPHASSRALSAGMPRMSWKNWKSRTCRA